MMFRFQFLYIIYVVITFLIFMAVLFLKRPRRIIPPIIWSLVMLTLPLILYYGIWLRVIATPLVDVPHIVGMTVPRAAEQLERVGLRLERTGSEQEQGIILEQYPAHGSRARRGRTVQVRLREISPWVQVPTLLGKSVEEAEKTLYGMGLGISGVSLEATGQKIVYQYPAPGIRMERGGSVEVGTAE